MEGEDFQFHWHPFPVFLLERKEGKDHLQRSLPSSGEAGWVKTICSLIISVLQEMKLMRQLRNHGPKGKRRKVTVSGSKNDLRSPVNLGNLLLFLSQICSARPFLFWVFGQVTFSLLKSFYWRIVDLQCCVSFRCTAEWLVLHVYISFSIMIYPRGLDIDPSAIHRTLLFTILNVIVLHLPASNYK